MFFAYHQLLMEDKKLQQPELQIYCYGRFPVIFNRIWPLHFQTTELYQREWIAFQTTVPVGFSTHARDRASGALSRVRAGLTLSLCLQTCASCWGRGFLGAGIWFNLK